MFFNRVDINWFKPIELRTKTGRRGHIKEPLGTHGHFKALFDRGISQQDTVLMNLYKRMFPKWNYDPHIPDYFMMQSKPSARSDFELPVVDKIQLTKKAKQPVVETMDL